MWMSQSCFSLRFLSQYSLWKLSTFRGYKGYLYWSKNGMRRVRFFKTELTGDLALRLDWVTSSSREQTELLDWTFCPVVLQLAWLFIFSACFTYVHHLAASSHKSPACSSRESLLLCTNLSISSHSFTHYPYMIST